MPWTPRVEGGLNQTLNSRAGGGLAAPAGIVCGVGGLPAAGGAGRPKWSVASPAA